ncbi:glycosyltransferase family 2 protein [Bacteroidota bacterium]
MTPLPLVSFIVPFYNSGSTILETLDSIKNQSYSNYDIWIINDGSTDTKSLEVLKTLENQVGTHVLHQENAGPSVARNQALSKTQAEFIVPLDSDDLIDAAILSSAIATMLENPEVGVVYGDLSFFGEKSGKQEQEIFDLQKQLLWNQIAATCLIRKSVFDTCGYYDEKLSKLGLEDWEYWIRVYTAGFKFKKIEKIFFSYRISNASRTYTEANVHLEEIKKYVYEKHAVLLAKQFETLFYERKMILETPDYRLGNLLLRPYRFVKSIFNQSKQNQID